MNRELLEEKLSELPLYIYDFFDPRELEFSSRIRWICENECPMYGKSWACPPGVGTVDTCRQVCMAYDHCLLISSIVEVRDIADMEETLATRPDHEALTNEVRDLMRAQGVEPYILSTEACSICEALIGSLGSTNGAEDSFLKQSFTILSSSEWNVITAHLPPTESISAASSSPALSEANS